MSAARPMSTSCGDEKGIMPHHENTTVSESAGVSCRWLSTKTCRLPPDRRSFRSGTHLDAELRVRGAVPDVTRRGDVDGQSVGDSRDGSNHWLLAFFYLRNVGLHGCACRGRPEERKQVDKPSREAPVS